MTKIKICGLFRERDIEYVNEARPDYAGFVFAQSKRQVTHAQAGKMRAGLSAGIVPVGVFVDASQEEIARLYAQAVISMAQLHGSEDEEYIESLIGLCGIPVIKAVRVRSADDAKKWDSSRADMLLLDSGAGTGRAFDWRNIPGLRKPYFLAGGICEENLKEALALSPFCVDISSGAETDGMKDRNKITRLVRSVRMHADSD